MCRCRPDSNSCSVAGGYGSPFTFLVSATNTDSHLLSCAESMSSSKDSGHLSELFVLFLELSQDLKFSNAHFVEFLVVFGMQGLDSPSNSSSLSAEKRFFFVGGSSWGWGWSRVGRHWGWGCN